MAYDLEVAARARVLVLDGTEAVRARGDDLLRACLVPVRVVGLGQFFELVTGSPGARDRRGGLRAVPEFVGVAFSVCPSVFNGAHGQFRTYVLNGMAMTNPIVASAVKGSTRECANICVVLVTGNP